MPKFAANLTLMFNELPFLDRFEAAARAGFGAVEFLFPYAYAPEEIAVRLRENGLALALFNLPPGDWGAGERGLAALPARFDDVCAGVEQALPYIRALGVRQVHLMAGLAEPGDGRADAAYLRAIRHACGRLGEHGVSVLIEPINRRDMPGYYLHDFSRALRLIEQLQLPNLGLQFDIYHRQILHGDVIRALETMLPVIRHIQIAAVPERHEPGTGELDDARLFARLDALGYQGYIGCEYRPRAGTLEGLGWFAPWQAETPAGNRSAGEMKA